MNHFNTAFSFEYIKHSHHRQAVKMTNTMTATFPIKFICEYVKITYFVLPLLSNIYF